LGEADRIWFVQTLRREVSELGSELVMAAVGGSGPTAVGDRAAAAGAGGLAVGGDVGGPVIQARGDVTLGKSEKDDQYDAVLSWDGNRSLRYFDLSGRDLSGLKLVGADMHGAKLTRADLSGANLAHADLRKADLSEANLSHADISEAYMLRFRPLKAILDEDIPSDEQGRLMLEYFFGDAARPDLRGAILTRADLSEANLNGADLRIASLQRVTLRDATLRYADLRRADLSEADLRGADLRGADLRDADLRQANLEGAVVTNQQLDQASSLKGATMPDGTKYGLLNRLGRIFE
jgi:uncharacterized protein YjbI with pentapeptide repeats